MNTNIVGVRIINKAHGSDIVVPEKQSFANAVHTIHHATVTRKNDCKDKIAIEYQARMFHHVPTRQMLRSLIRPIRLVNFTDRG